MVRMGQEDKTKRRHHVPGQVFLKLRAADRLLGERTPLVGVCKHLYVTEATYCRLAASPR